MNTIILDVHYFDGDQEFVECDDFIANFQNMQLITYLNGNALVLPLRAIEYFKMG